MVQNGGELLLAVRGTWITEYHLIISTSYPYQNDSTRPNCQGPRPLGSRLEVNFSGGGTVIRAVAFKLKIPNCYLFRWPCRSAESRFDMNAIAVPIASYEETKYANALH